MSLKLTIFWLLFTSSDSLISIVYLKDDIIVTTHTILIRSAVKTIASLIKLGSECNIIKNIKKKIKAKIQLIITNISSSPY